MNRVNELINLINLKETDYKNKRKRQKNVEKPVTDNRI